MPDYRAQFSMKIGDMIKWLVLVLFLNISTAFAEKVDVELAFLVDTSGSITDAQLRIQRESIRNALKSERVLRIISDNYHMKIAVGYFEFADTSIQVGKWQIISTTEDIDNLINSFPEERFSNGGTHTYIGIFDTVKAIYSNHIESTTQNLILFTDDVTTNRNYAQYVISKLYEESPLSLSVSGIMLVYSPLLAETTLQWMQEEVVHGAKPYIKQFSHEHVEYIISRMLEIETQ